MATSDDALIKEIQMCGMVYRRGKELIPVITYPEAKRILKLVKERLQHGRS